MRGRSVLWYRKEVLKKILKYFKKLTLNFQWHRAALTWNSLGCWGILGSNRWIQLTFHVQYSQLLEKSLCPFLATKEPELGRLGLQSGNVQWFFLGRGSWAEHCCPPLTQQKTQLEDPRDKRCEWPGTSRDTKEWDLNGEITQKRQFREKTPHCYRWPDCFLREERDRQWRAGAVNSELHELLAKPKQYWE